MKFDILVVDPPWAYNNKKTGKGGNSSASSKYETLGPVEIQNLWDWGIDKVMNDNCVLFMWTTNSMLPYAICAVELWGFDYKTMITWVKKNYGLGNWFRGKTEHILFGVKGKFQAFDINKPNIMYSDKTLKHSEKPKEFYEYVNLAGLTLLHDYGSRVNVLELFARNYEPPVKELGVSWKCIGKEITGNSIEIDLEKLQKL